MLDRRRQNPDGPAYAEAALSGVVFNDLLRAEYDRHLAEAVVSVIRKSEVRVACPLLFDRRYVEVWQVTGVPAKFIGVMHHLEASGSFLRHLHNGDLLTGRTVNAPAGRPT